MEEKLWYKNETGEYICKICGKKSTKDGIGNHIKYHNGYKNPRTGKSWNKGLTKENCESLKKVSETRKKSLQNGKLIHNWTGKKHSEETRKKWKENPNMGGLRHGSGRGKKGWYKGFYCRSTWELAWLVYQIEHNIKVDHCYDTFEYCFEGEKHRYYPDFMIGEDYIEIKGFRYSNTQAKIDQFPKEKNLVMIEGKKEIKPYLNYVEEKYGKEFWKILYE